MFCQAAVLSVSAKLSCQSYKLSSAKLQASQFCQDPISILFPAKGEGWGDLAPNTPMSAASWADITHIKQVNYTNISQLLSRLSPNTSRVKPEQGERVTGKMVVFSWFIFTYTLLYVGRYIWWQIPTYNTKGN